MARVRPIILAALLLSACEIRNDDTAPLFAPTLVFSADTAAAPDTLFNRSKTFTFTVQNLAVNAGTISLAAGPSPPFAIVSPAFPATIGPLETITITVRFTPTGLGTFTDSLILQTTDPQKPQIGIVLTGRGIDAEKTEILLPGGNLLIGTSRTTVISTTRVIATSPGPDGAFGGADDGLAIVIDGAPIGALIVAAPGQSAAHIPSIAGTSVTLTDVAGFANRIDTATAVALAPQPLVGAVSAGIGSSPVDIGGSTAAVLATDAPLAGVVNIVRFGVPLVDSDAAVGTFDLDAAASRPVAASATRIFVAATGGAAAYGGAGDTILAVDVGAAAPFPIHNVKAVGGAPLFTLSPALSRPVAIDAATMAFFTTAHPVTGVAGNFLVKIAITAFGLTQDVTVLDLDAAGLGAPVGEMTLVVAGDFVFVAEGPVADGFGDRLVEVSIDAVPANPPALVQAIVLAPPPTGAPTLAPFNAVQIDFGDDIGDRVGRINLGTGSFATFASPNVAAPSSVPARDSSNNLLIAASAPTNGIHIFEDTGAGTLTTTALPGVAAAEASRIRGWDTLARKFVLGVPAPAGSNGLGALFRVTVPE